MPKKNAISLSTWQATMPPPLLTACLARIGQIASYHSAVSSKNASVAYESAGIGFGT